MEQSQEDFLPAFDPSAIKIKKKQKRNVDESTEPILQTKFIKEEIKEEELGALYTYEELLDRAFKTFEAKPTKSNIRIGIPEVYRISTKTQWSNFSEICKNVSRDPNHILTYVTTELGTIASLDVNGKLLIKGVYKQKEISNILTTYISEYVECKSCKSKNTIMVKENRLYFISCQSVLCKSKRSVAALNKGYVHTLKREKH